MKYNANGASEKHQWSFTSPTLLVFTMDSHYDTNGEAYHPELVAGSPDRPPQFNESSCGYRCGWGCCEPKGGDDDGGGSQSDVPTLVNYGGDDDMAFSLPDADHNAHQRAEVGVVEDLGETAQPIAYVENNMHRHQIVIVDEDTSLSSHQYQSLDEADSLENEASSGPHSVVAFDGRSVEFIMPDELIGIRDWIEDFPLDYPEVNEAGQVPSNTLFHVAPLRLSFQYEHCRGNPYSHMVVQDDIELPVPAEANWPGYAPTFHRAFCRVDDYPSH